MNTVDLFVRELRFRPIGFLLGLTAATAVAASIIGACGFFAAHDAETESLVAALEERAATRMAQLRDDARVFSKSLGFNILLLPAGQDAGQLYAENRSTHFFVSEQVAALGKAKFATLNHLLPMLRHRVHWEAYGGDVILIGVEGEIYIKSPSFQKPIEENIQPGVVHIGNAIGQRLGVLAGDSVTLLDETFTVRRVLPQKGNVDDISLLMNLGDVQRLAGQPGKVTGILALSCNCAVGDLDLIRRETERVVQGVQVVEFTTLAQARQRAREMIGKGTKEQMADIKQSRGAMRAQAARFASVLVTLVVVGAAIFLAVLTSASVRERRTEMAMLRAVGLGARSVIALMLYKAVFMGAAGGVLGCFTGLLIGRWVQGATATVTLPFMGTVIGATALVSVLAAAVPATIAARTDPAVILNQE